MEYIISNYNKQILEKNIMDTDHYNEVIEILDNLQPVELVAEGEVITKKFGKSEECYIGEEIDLGFWVMENWTGQNIKIYIQKVIK